MCNIGYEIERLLNFALKKEMISKWDVIPSRNALIDLLKVEAPFEGEVEEVIEENAVGILNNILDFAVETGLIEEDTTTLRDLFDAKIMGLLMPREGEVVKSFYDKYENESKEKATDWFYDLSKASNYIMTERIAKNLWWPAKTEYGDLEITVNLSKPEKDPKEIAKAKLMKSTSYPKCLLCKQNEGFRGNINHPARQNHRIIPMEFAGENWFLQYSPYVYYNEHCIILNAKHTPMKIYRKTFENLLGFVEKLPHYFAGSNADLPIVGGSILSHDHYQGGHYTFAMAKAPIEQHVILPGFEDVEAGIVKWPLSVLRIRHKDSNRLVDLATHVLEVWRGYTDEEAFIYAETNGEPHNTITPIARKVGDTYELDLTLRNNITTEEHPLGVYHPHAEYHHIKKENIGLIEVMGLAVLPARLKGEMELLEEYILEGKDISSNEQIEKHAEWVKKFLPKYPEITKENIHGILQKEIGIVFTHVLEDAGVYKCTTEGREAFMRFLETL